MATSVTGKIAATIKSAGESIALLFMTNPITAIVGCVLVGLVISNAATFAVGLVTSLKEHRDVKFEWHIWGFKFK